MKKHLVVTLVDLEYSLARHFVIFVKLPRKGIPKIK